MTEYLLKACEVCERGAAIASMRSISFIEGRLHAFNGIYQYQAPSGLDPAEKFSVSEDKLASALRTCGEESELSVTKEFLRIKNGPFSVRVKKLEPTYALEVIKLPKSAAKNPSDALLSALRIVRPFISDDASRPWSVSAQIDAGYVWASNNLSLARSPLDCKLLNATRLPAPAVDFICELKAPGFFHRDDKDRIIISSGKALIRFPQSLAEWPDVSKMLKGIPKKLPEVPKEMSEAAQRVGKFSDRFTSLSGASLSGKGESVEAEYELDLKKGKGVYNAKLLTLILSHATHIDFSFYPAPIFFRGDRLEGTAVGLKPDPVIQKDGASK